MSKPVGGRTREQKPSWRGQAGQSIALLKRFTPFVRPQRTRLGLAGGATIGYVAMGLLEPWPIKLIFDYVLPRKDLHGWPWELVTPISQDPLPALTLMVLSLLIIAGTRAMFDYVVERWTATAGQGIAASLRQSLYSHLQSLSLTFHDRRQTGELMTRLTGDIVLLRELLVNALITLSSSSLILVGMAVVMFWLDWQLTLVALTTAPLLLLLSSRYMANIKQAVRAQRRREGHLASTIHETLSLIKVVQVFQREAHERRRFEETNDASLVQGVRAAKLEAELGRATDLILAVGTAVVLLLGALRVTQGIITAGDLIVFTAYLRAMYRPMRDISRLTERLSKIAACGERLIDLFDTQPDIREVPGAVDLQQAAGRVTFENVSFAYPGGQQVLTDISFDAFPGQCIALVGTTGAGKSSILGLVPRLYDVAEGTVRLDGHDVRSLTLESLRSQISIVLQESVLFSTTLRDNIAYGKLDATEEEIEAAARAANIHDFICSLPDSYNTVVGERGATLSGGQRQRIAIARAMIRNTPILLLDEPTTGLDAKTEEVVMDALRRLMEGRTTIVVTHRLPIIRSADQILIIEGGQLVECGEHAELLRLNGRYRKLFDLQAVSSARTEDPILIHGGESDRAKGHLA